MCQKKVVTFKNKKNKNIIAYERPTKVFQK